MLSVTTVWTCCSKNDREARMSILDLLAPITGEPSSVELPTAENWMQGRTLYGGASALIAYTQAIRAFPDLPPLRAAQIGFVAPIGDKVELSAQIARQGRSVTQLRSEIHCDGKLALTAFWLFAQPREANAQHPAQKPARAARTPERPGTRVARSGPEQARGCGLRPSVRVDGYPAT